MQGYAACVQSLHRLYTKCVALCNSLFFFSFHFSAFCITKLPKFLNLTLSIITFGSARTIWIDQDQ